MVTRRVTQQQSFLRPSRQTNQIVAYCIASAAEHTGVQLHAVTVMSNHWHAVLTDPQARVPEFLERVHRSIAKCLNATMGRWENFWSSDKPSIVRLVTEQDVLDKMAYVLANPTTAGLVHSPDEWPGLITRRIGESHAIEKPEVFFDQEQDEEVRLVFIRPPIFPELDDMELNALLIGSVQRLVRRARDRMKAAGRSFGGVRAVLSEPLTNRPKTAAQRRKLNPRIAAKDPSSRIGAIATLKRFAAAYRVALEAWRQGERERLFPAGTYGLRVRAGVYCEPLVPL
ncbi:MAG TPA: hypothetical protein VM686_09595 [Polyangiaceae bacterium]|nr:hypothetical protein [Polyangiaceae bacterium]